MSEDVLTPAPADGSISSISAGQANGLKSAKVGQGSSPLRTDDDVPARSAASEGSSDGGEWVKRTEDVHLHEAAEKGNKYLEQYNHILCKP